MQMHYFLNNVLQMKGNREARSLQNCGKYTLTFVSVCLVGGAILTKTLEK